VPNRARYEDDITWTGYECPIAIQNFQLAVNHLEGLVLVGMCVCHRSTKWRDHCLDQT
jgi:hypothetical protein